MVESHRNKNHYVFAAIEKRDIEKVLQLILLPGYDINYYSTKKRATPLILAAKLGLLSICEKLIQLGVDVTCTDINLRSALHHASYHGNINIVQLLIKAGCSIRSENIDGDQPLHEAVTNGNPETVELLIQAGSDVNRPNPVTGSTPLDLAVLHEREDIVEVLLRFNADAHHTSGARETALHFAVQVGSSTIIKHLLDVGADINATNLHGETALSIAIQERKIPMVKYLVQSGCQYNYTYYMSPLSIACRQNSQGIVCYLLSEGYNVSKDRSLRRFIYLNLEDTNPELLMYLYSRSENPLTLKESCRLTVRRLLKPPIRNSVLMLRIPLILKQWIAEDDIYSEIFPGK